MTTISKCDISIFLFFKTFEEGFITRHMPWASTVKIPQTRVKTLLMRYEQKGKHEISILVFQNKIHLPFYCDRMSEVFSLNYQAYHTSVYSFSYIFKSRNLTHTNYHEACDSYALNILACVWNSSMFLLKAQISVKTLELIQTPN